MLVLVCTAQITSKDFSTSAPSVQSDTLHTDVVIEGY